MEILHQPGKAAFQLTFGDKLTYDFYRELETRAFEAMRQHKNLEFDLSEVREIDFCGIHFLGLLQSVGVIVAASPVVEQAFNHVHAYLHHAVPDDAAESECIWPLLTHSP